MGLVFSQNLFSFHFPASRLLDVCQAAQLVKSDQRGISETLGDVKRGRKKKDEAGKKKTKKNRNRSPDCLLASRLCLHCVASLMRPHPPPPQCAPCVVSVHALVLPPLPPPDEVMMRDGAAGRACHCQSLFWLLFFASCPRKKRCFMGINSHRVSCGVTARLSVYLCIFTYPGVEGVFLKWRLCVYVCVCVLFANMHVAVAFFFFKSQPAGKKHHQKLVTRYSPSRGAQ